MSTTKAGFGFFLVISILVMGVTSCGEKELAKVEITILEEYTASQGQVLQTRPLEAAEVHFYVPGAPHIEAIEITSSHGKVYFEYEYEALVHVDVMVQNVIAGREIVALKPGETTKETIVISQ